MSWLAKLPRRHFLKLAGAAAATAGVPSSAFAIEEQNVQIVVDPSDPIASAAPVAWAVSRLQKTLSDKGVATQIVPSLNGIQDQAKGTRRIIMVSGHGAPPPGFATPPSPATHPESVRTTPGRVADAEAILVTSPGALGLVYGLTDLADRVEYSTDSILGLRLSAPIDEAPANEIRSAARAFCSEIEDKSWYYSKDFWRGYLDALVTSRFNRFNLAFGFGYDFPVGVTGDYFHFPYPYLVEVPGYNVRVVPLPEGERERNLETLRFIAAETARRGLQFQLGLWTHAYQWTNSPRSDHHIEGLTPQTQAPYCRDALAMLLKLCPEITGLTLRVHGESGVPEGSYDFWRTLFTAITKCGRTVEIDMHAKGVNQIMIDMANDTGMPVKLGAKSWAEHMGLGYQQTDIRELEIPTPERMEGGTFNVSNGERRFTRYGYADYFKEGRKYNVLFRLWPGTQRHLLWGDPEMAAAYGRTAHFCGAAGLEICEPLTFKGREGSGHPGGRCAYLDKTLEPVADWEKFAYTYRLWGRMLYNPDTPPEVWRRSLTRQFGPGAAAAESAMANASRVLPLFTTAHLPSASNHSYWPEIYADMAITSGQKTIYSDSPKPYRFGTVSPIDPQVFSSVQEYVAGLMEGSPSPKYSPLTVALWLEGFTDTSSKALDLFRKQSSRKASPEYRRWEEDLLIQIGLGRFFAAKLRSAVAFEIFLNSGDPAAGKTALARYKQARDAWAAMAQRAAGIYEADISYGSLPNRRGDWAARLPGIDSDIAALQTALEQPPAETAGATRAASSLALVTSIPPRTRFPAQHTPGTSFTPGQALPVSVTVNQSIASADLFYRHVNQGERWKSVPMTKSGSGFTSAIPADYTQSVYPLQYYFVLRQGASSGYHPEFNATLSNQPYFALWHRS